MPRKVLLCQFPSLQEGRHSPSTTTASSCLLSSHASRGLKTAEALAQLCFWPAVSLVLGCHPALARKGRKGPRLLLSYQVRACTKYSKGRSDVNLKPKVAKNGSDRGGAFACQASSSYRGLANRGWPKNPQRNWAGLNHSRPTAVVLASRMNALSHIQSPDVKASQPVRTQRRRSWQPSLATAPLGSRMVSLVSPSLRLKFLAMPAVFLLASGVAASKRCHVRTAQAADSMQRPPEQPTTWDLELPDPVPVVENFRDDA